MAASLIRRLTLCKLSLCETFKTGSDEGGIWGQCQKCGKRVSYINRASLREIGEVVARVRQRSLAVCETCGGEGYTDSGRSACGECYGAGVMTPELATRLRASALPDDRSLCECRIGQCHLLTERCREIE